MEMYYLIVAMWTYSAVIMPEKYPLDQCEAAGKKLILGGGYRCVLAPKDDYYNCATSVPDPMNPAQGKIIKTHCDIKTGN